MKFIHPFTLLCFIGLFLLGTSCENETGTNTTDEPNTNITPDTQEVAEYAMVIHGGAGTLRRADMTAEKDSMYRSALDSALTIGEQILQSGGSAADAVEQTINYLENVPLFNAGKGAVFTAAGQHELDASFMDGATLNAGAVGGVTNVKHPITAARAVMENSEHVFLSGPGAEEFALEQGLETVPNSYFFTQHRYDALQEAQAAEAEVDSERTSMLSPPFPDHKFGTVGCVALDKEGNIVAGTSTGGMTNKKYGRIGDSPIIGAGTYANNATCGVSCTGHGEFFIRYAVAYDVHAYMAYAKKTLADATEAVVMEKLVDAGGSGGLIALDKYGNISMTYNTEGMYRGYVKPGERVVGIYKDE